MVDRSVYEIRQQNLKRLLHEKCNGDYETLGKAINKAEGTVRRLLAKGMDRKINDKTARLVEERFGLPDGYMDTLRHGQSKVYYVTLKVGHNYSAEIVKQLHDNNYPEVVECAAVLGEFDILAKVEAEGFRALEIFLDKLSRLPGVMRTRTLPAINSIRWQRSQSAYASLKDPDQFPNFAEEYKHKLILQHLDEIRRLERGEIISHDTSPQSIRLADMVARTAKRYFAVRLHDEIIPDAEVYFEAEKEALQNNNITVKRIITLPEAFIQHHSNVDALDNLLETAQRMIDIGGEIRFVYDKNWVTTKASTRPECFAIIDNQFIYVRHINEPQAMLQIGQDHVTTYRQAFRRNWERGLTLETMIQYRDNLDDNLA